MKGLFLVCAVASLCLSLVAGDAADLDSSNFDALVGQGKPALVEFYAPWCGHCKSLAPEWESLGNSFKKSSEVLIAKVDADKHKDLAGRFGVSGYPTIKWFPKGSQVPEDYSGGRTAEDLANFVNERVGTRVRIANSSPVTVLTDKNFDSIVLDSSKDVFVEFYAPWCGHCKRLAPDYDKFAESFAGEEDVVIAKLDSDKYRDTAGKYDISGYPTLKFFPKNNKEGELYQGGRTPEDFVKFINERSGTQRIVGGGYTADAGRIPELEDFATEFFASSNKNSLISRANEVAKGLDKKLDKLAKFYIAIFKKVAKESTDVISAEIERTSKILSSGSLAPEKSAEFSKRANILNGLQSKLAES